MTLARVFTIKLSNGLNLKNSYNLKAILDFSGSKCTNHPERYGKIFPTEFSTYSTVSH